MTLHGNILWRFLARPLVGWGEVHCAPADGGDALQCGVRLSRHDHHNLEIKTWLEPTFSSANEDQKIQIDIFVFIPRSLQVHHWAKSELGADFRSRSRLTLPLVSAENKNVAEDALRRRCEPLLNPVQYTEGGLKQVTTWVSDHIKRQGRRHARQWVMAHALSMPEALRVPEMQRVIEQVQATHGLVLWVRSSLKAVQVYPLVDWIDEYLSNFLVQFLGRMRRALHDSSSKSLSAPADEAHSTLTRLLDTVQREEAHYRTRFTQVLEAARSDREREHAVLRLGQLKKFFQAQVFMEVDRHSPSGRFLETTAIGGTAIAGACWALIQMLGGASAQLGTAHPGALMVALAVVAYVLRDRIKDRARASLQSRVQKWLPDADHCLRAQGKTIGQIQEWFNLCPVDQVPDRVQKGRWQAASNAVEKGQAEDILHMRKLLSVPSNPGRLPGWALQENTRVNLERYLKHMDDPVKELTLLAADGTLAPMKSRRVYYFYVLLELTVGQGVRSQWHRVVLDKRGIDRLEPL